MTTIAITGGIGSGKSQIFSLLKKRGYPVLDADVISAEAVLIPEIKSQMMSKFGPHSYDASGNYNRSHIRDVVFKNPEKRAELEAILHPQISQLFAERQLLLEGVSKSAWLFYEAALIFEAGRQKSFDAVILVTAPLEVRLDRLQTLRGLAREQAERVVKSQWDDAQKSLLADYVVRNNSTLKDLEIATEAMIVWLSERFFPSPGL